MLAEFSNQQVIEEISSLYEDLPNPLLAGSNIASAMNAFNKLRAFDTRECFRVSGVPIFTRQEYSYDLHPKIHLQAPSSFNDASDFFHRHNRMLAGHVNFNSPIEAWKDRRKRKLVLKSLFSLKQPQLTVNAIETSFALRHYVASQFKPAIAKAIYDLFDACDVWDPSAGWGDRFAGFSASSRTRSYVGTDPNENLHEGYWIQGLAYSTGKAYLFKCEGAEVVNLSDYKFDLVFTSPPYFNTEKYSEHEGQSWKRYANFPSWQEDFLHKMIHTAWKSLRKGGVLVLNIADLGTKNDRAQVCDPMNDYIASLPGARYIGGLGMRLSARPQTGLEQEEKTTFVEPVWIWSKKGSMTLDDYLDRHLGAMR